MKSFVKFRYSYFHEIFRLKPSASDDTQGVIIKTMQTIATMAKESSDTGGGAGLAGKRGDGGRQKEEEIRLSFSRLNKSRQLW